MDYESIEDRTFLTMQPNALSTFFGARSTFERRKAALDTCAQRLCSVFVTLRGRPSKIVVRTPTEIPDMGLGDTTQRLSLCRCDTTRKYSICAVPVPHTCCSLRADQRLRHILITAVSASTQLPARCRCQTLGAGAGTWAAQCRSGWAGGPATTPPSSRGRPVTC